MVPLTFKVTTEVTKNTSCASCSQCEQVRSCLLFPSHILRVDGAHCCLQPAVTPDGVGRCGWQLHHPLTPVMQAVIWRVAPSPPPIPTVTAVSGRAFDGCTAHVLSRLAVCLCAVLFSRRRFYCCFKVRNEETWRDTKYGPSLATPHWIFQKQTNEPKIIFTSLWTKYDSCSYGMFFKYPWFEEGHGTI